MKQLSEECQRFIVQAIAVSMPLPEVSQAVKIHSMADLSEEELRLYDPTQDLNPDRVSPYLIRLFAATHAYYQAGINSWADECVAGYATKGHRLARLQRAYDIIEDGDDIAKLSPQKTWLVLNILEEVAKVSNDWYERGGDVSTGDARMIRLVTLGRDVDELLKDYAGDD
jgi:hypothetical protein